MWEVQNLAENAGNHKKKQEFAENLRLSFVRLSALLSVLLEQQVQKKTKKREVREIPKEHSSLFFQYNTNLRPPYQLLLDTNFINMAIQMKLELAMQHVLVLVH